MSDLDDGGYLSMMGMTNSHHSIRGFGDGGRKSLLVLVSLGLALAARSQVWLNAGESYTHRFTSLGPASVSCCAQPGTLVAQLAPDSVQPGDVVRVELFEGELDVGPLTNRLFESTNMLVCAAAGTAWWDATGSFRITVLSGAVRLTNLQMSASSGPVFGTFRRYSVNVLPSAPKLAIALAGTGQAQVMWETNYPGYLLEGSTDLPAAVWNPLTNVVTTMGDHFLVRLNSQAPQRFFRLRRW